MYFRPLSDGLIKREITARSTPQSISADFDIDTGAVPGIGRFAQVDAHALRLAIELRDFTREGLSRESFPSPP